MHKIIIFLLFLFCQLSLFAQKTVKLQIQRGNTGYPNMACFSPDGNFLYTSGINDQETHLWEIKTGREIKTFPQTWLFMQFSRDGKRIFVLEQESIFSIFDAQTHQPLKKYQLATSSTQFALTQDEKMVYFYGKYQSNAFSEYMFWDEKKRKYNFEKESLKLYTLDNQRDTLIKTKIKKFEDLKKIKFSGEQLDLSFGIKTKKLNSDDPESQDIDDKTQLVNRIFISHEFYGDFRSDSLNIPPANYNDKLYKFYQSGQKVILVRLDRRLLLYDIATQKVERELYGHSAAITALQVSPDNQLLMTASEDDSVKVWDIKSGRVLRQLHGYAAPINVVKFSPDGKKLISGGEDGWVRVWDLAMGKVTINMMHLNGIMDIALQQKGEIIASLSADRTIKIWEANSGKNLHTFKRYIQKINYDYRFVPRLAFVPETSTLIHSAEWDYFTGGFGGTTVYGSHLSAWDTQKGTLQHYTKLMGEFRSGIFSDRNNQYCVWSNILINHERFANFFKDAEVEVEQKLKIYPMDMDSKGEFILFLSSQMDIVNQFVLAKRNAKGEYVLQTMLPDEDVSLAEAENNFAVLSKDLQKMYLARRDGKIIMYQTFANEPAPVDRKQPYLFKKIGEWQAHNNEVNYLDVSPDGKTLASAGSDGLIKLWNLSDNQLIVSLLPLRDSESFTIFTPENYYLSNKDATKVIHFIDDEGGVYLFDQFDVQYNRPDKVLEKIGASSPEIIDTYRKAYEKRLKKQGFNLDNFEKERSFNVPQIKLPQLKNYYSDTQNADYQLFIEAKDKLYRLDRLNIWVNGVPILGSKGIDLKPRQTQEIAENFNFKLSEGYNLVEVAVLNEKGVESLKEQFEVNLTSPSGGKGALFLITIGVSKYQNPQMNLTYAQKDAQDIAQAFGGKKDLFSQIIHLPLYNENASEEQILNLKTRLAETRVDDYVIVTFSGHGLLDEKKDYYLATHAVNFTKPQEKGLAYDKFESILDGIPARHKILLIDACHSGEVDKDENLSINQRQLNEQSKFKGVIKARNFNSQAEKDQNKNKTKPEIQNKEEENIDLDFDIASAKISLPNSFELMRELFTDLRRTSGTTVISAAGGAEFALEGTDWNNGVFTYTLLSGLKEMRADANKDGKITLSEIKNYVQKTVPELTGGRQQPTSRIENLINDFRVW
ncbi:MAG: caspase family protein [Microscillaceae bacterium]|jgi:WD40 repeat protein|nr:caspase family protein [Microscillaceae bacterium]